MVHHFCSGFTVYPFSLDPGLIFGEADSLHISILLFSLMACDLSKKGPREKIRENTNWPLSILKQFPNACWVRDITLSPPFKVLHYIVSFYFSTEFPTMLQWTLNVLRSYTWVSRRLKWEVSSQDPRLQPEQPHFYLTMENRLVSYDAQRRQTFIQPLKTTFQKNISWYKKMFMMLNAICSIVQILMYSHIYKFVHILSM